jgi:hypothetical protein
VSVVSVVDLVGRVQGRHHGQGELRFLSPCRQQAGEAAGASLKKSETEKFLGVLIDTKSNLS